MLPLHQVPVAAGDVLVGAGGAALFTGITQLVAGVLASPGTGDDGSRQPFFGRQTADDLVEQLVHFPFECLAAKGDIDDVAGVAVDAIFAESAVIAIAEIGPAVRLDIVLEHLLYGEGVDGDGEVVTVVEHQPAISILHRCCTSL